MFAAGVGSPAHRANSPKPVDAIGEEDCDAPGSLRTSTLRDLQSTETQSNSAAATSSRPNCVHCGYDVTDLAPIDGRLICPECGKAPFRSPVSDAISKLGPAAALGAVASLLPPVGSVVLFWKINTIGPWLQEHGVQGLMLYAVAFAVLSAIAVVPTYASSVLGGWAFGFAMGYPAALGGFVGGAVIGYFIGRAFARDRVVALIKEHPKWQTVKDALVGSGTWRTLWITTLIRLTPSSPFALTNYLLSSLRIPLWLYTIATLLGMAPRTAITVFIASTLQDQIIEKAAEAKPWWLVAVSIAVTVVVFLVIGTIATKALHHATRPDNREPAKA